MPYTEEEIRDRDAYIAQEFKKLKMEMTGPLVLNYIHQHEDFLRDIPALREALAKGKAMERKNNLDKIVKMLDDIGEEAVIRMDLYVKEKKKE